MFFQFFLIMQNLWCATARCPKNREAAPFHHSTTTVFYCLLEVHRNEYTFKSSSQICPQTFFLSYFWLNVTYGFVYWWVNSSFPMKTPSMDAFVIHFEYSDGKACSAFSVCFLICQCAVGVIGDLYHYFIFSPFVELTGAQSLINGFVILSRCPWFCFSSDWTCCLCSFSWQRVVRQFLFKWLYASSAQAIIRGDGEIKLSFSKVVNYQVAFHTG